MDEGATKGHWVVLQVILENSVIKLLCSIPIISRTFTWSENGCQHLKRNWNFIQRDPMTTTEFSSVLNQLQLLQVY